MALVDKVAPVRKEIPHEPGQWMEFRPLTYSESVLPVMEGLAAAISAWSYDEPVTVKTVDRLDLKTSNWAARQLIEFYEESSEGEASATSSTATT